MFCSKVLFFIVAVVCFENISTHLSLSAEEKAALKAQGEPLLKDCAQEFNYTDEQLEELKKQKLHDVDPCFAACFLKKTGVFDSKGMYDNEKAFEIMKTYIKNVETLAAMQEIKQECGKVNDEEVSDGEKGCERAKLFTECIKTHKDLLDLEKE